jgi:hypothetical protein
MTAANFIEMLGLNSIRPASFLPGLVQCDICGEVDRLLQRSGGCFGMPIDLICEECADPLGTYFLPDGNGDGP